ncbi:MAG: hypothetical protein IKC65_06915 [Lentisphaeria bacterium]|nr:hypothetical protein [Lentisphaeria bacterium]
MKKPFFIFFAALLLPGGLWAGKAAVGRDTPDQPCSSEKADGTFSRHTRALEFYIAGLLEKNPDKRLNYLLESVSLDPRRKLSVLLLVKSLDKVPGRSAEVREKLASLRKALPEDVFFLLQYVQAAARSGAAPGEIAALCGDLLRKKPAPEDMKYFQALALRYVEALLAAGQKTIQLPFEASDPALQEAALLYYSISAKRDTFSLVPSIAARERDKYLELLKKSPLTNAAGFRRRMAFFGLIKADTAAFETAEKWYDEHKDSFGAVMLIEAAAQTGNVQKLEALLKKYPGISVAFCAKKRLQAYTAAGNFDRAMRECANLTSPAEKESNRFTTALKFRNVRAAARALEACENIPGFSKEAAALERLSLAELSLNKADFFKAEKVLAPRVRQNMMIANAVAYVSAVLDVELKKAEELMTFVLSREPRNAAYLDSMAWVKFKQKDYPAAEKYIRKGFRCLDHGVSGAVMAEHAGDIYLALKQPLKALAYYQLALQVFQDSPRDNPDLDPQLLKKKITSLTSGTTK